MYLEMPKYQIGCSGFLYDSWKGAFYPDDLPHKRWLAFYMSKLSTVEINVTFYRLLKKEAFERWYKETPEGFSFCLKGSRFITHVKKLKDVELPLSTFFNATAPLLEKLDCILWQLPPNLKLNMKNLEDFVANLKQYPVRHVLEVRHKTWLTKKVFNLLSDANIAICMADWPPFIDDLPVTADFVYLRRHGEGGTYSTNYTPEQLKLDAKRIKEYLKLGKDVYLYFNNDAFAFAPKNSIELNAILENIIPKSLLKEDEPIFLKPLKSKADKKKAAAKVEAKKAVLKKELVKRTAAKIIERAAEKTSKEAEAKTTKKAEAKTTKKTEAKTTKTAETKTTKKVVTKSKEKTASTAVKKTIKKAASKTPSKTLKKSK